MGSTDFFDDDLVKRRGSGKGSGLGQGTDIVGPARHDEMPARPVSDLNLARMAKHREEMNAQVATAKVEIERLRRRQSDLEREKQALEDLGQKQEQYERGRQEMTDRITESLVGLERLEADAMRLVEIYSGARQRHLEMLKELQGINDSDWADEAFREELNKALALIDTIRKEYVKSQAAVEAAGGAGAAEQAAAARPLERRRTEMPTGFGTWLKIGFAMTLPLVILILLLIALVLFSGLGRV